MTVPAGLVCATNGRRLSSETAGGLTTSHWRVTTPIANYTVALNIAPYLEISRTVKSVAGDEYPVIFWALPENEEKARAFMDEIVEHLAFFEEFCGPYPFRGDKYGVVETPHLGMEHQSIIAYGNRYKGDPNFDYDWLHHHELAHEWWANLVTCSDWADFWIHEGIGTYMQPLYLERKFGREAYDKKMRLDLLRVLNQGPVAPGGPPRTTDSIYFSQEGDDAPGIDIYMKGSWICHSLRWLLGDETFFQVLRRWAYPDPALEKTTDGSTVRFSDTDEIQAIAERVSEVELDWFFQAYLRTAALPELVHSTKDGVLTMEWRAPGGGSLPDAGGGRGGRRVPPRRDAGRPGLGRGGGREGSRRSEPPRAQGRRAEVSRGGCPPRPASPPAPRPGSRRGPRPTGTRRDVVVVRDAVAVHVTRERGRRNGLPALPAAGRAARRRRWRRPAAR